MTAPRRPAPCKCDRLYDSEQLAEYLGIDPKTLLKWNRDGRICPPLQNGQGWLRWRHRDVDVWLESRRVTTAA